MAVFIGKRKNTSAKAGLTINYAVYKIINPAIARQYGSGTYTLSQVVGIDTNELFVARIGVKNDNDLVWVGRAANYAANLCALNEPNTVFITGDVFDSMKESMKYYGNLRESIWRPREWSNMDYMRIHSSTWWWTV